MQNVYNKNICYNNSTEDNHTIQAKCADMIFEQTWTTSLRSNTGRHGHHPRDSSHILDSPASLCDCHALHSQRSSILILERTTNMQRSDARGLLQATERVLVDHFCSWGLLSISPFQFVIQGLGIAVFNCNQQIREGGPGIRV
jgi:hypothetical protein